jgi:tetratricopeptide (TPR) repeat protein
MLEYFVARATVWLWVVEKDRVEFVSTSIAKSDLIAKVKALRDTIYQLSEKDRFTVLAQELYKLLIEPSLPHIKGKEVVIVPHDVLHYLPFQTLQGTDGRYLIEKYPIYYLSSASLLQFTAEKRRAKGDNVLAFGNPDLGDTEIFLGLGRAYVAKKDYPRAMENMVKALQMAEARRQMSYIQQASSGVGDVFLETQRVTEAILHYKKAIDSIESTRSLLQSEELRTSFFSNKEQTYGGIIEAQLRTKNFEEAFNYNERARSRAFLDILGSKVQLARSGTMLEHERALQARISVLRAMVEGQEADSAGTADLRKDLVDAERAYGEYLSQVRKENKEQASLMNVEPLTGTCQ